MDIEHTACECIDYRVGQYAHIAGQHYEVWLQLRELTQQRIIERLFICMRLIVHRNRGDAGVARAGQSKCRRFVANNTDDISIDSAALLRINDGL